jgi:hypothetical protein
MRILTLVTGPEAVPEALSLAGEIREFNSTIDFRLRFLDADIANLYVAPGEAAGRLRDEQVEIRDLEADGPIEAAAALALLLDRERPALFLIAGTGPLRDAGTAAARAAGAKLALLDDLGADARQAVEKISGVARELP